MKRVLTAVACCALLAGCGGAAHHSSQRVGGLTATDISAARATVSTYLALVSHGQWNQACRILEPHYLKNELKFFRARSCQDAAHNPTFAAHKRAAARERITHASAAAGQALISVTYYDRSGHTGQTTAYSLAEISGRWLIIGQQ